MVLSLVIAACLQQAKPLDEVPALRFEHVKRGINLGLHLTQADSLSEYQQQIRREDIQQLTETGFRFIRFDISSALLCGPGQHVDPARRKSFLRALNDLLVNEDVSVDLVLPTFRVGTSFDGYLDQIREIAGVFGDVERDRIFVEAIAPGSTDAKDDQVKLEAIDAALRSQLANHTLILEPRGGWFDSSDDVVALADKNVIYAFRYDHPYTFTHQGAAAEQGPVRFLKNVPYPSSPTAVSGLLVDIEKDEPKKALYTYGRERWDADRIQSEIREPYNWAKKNKVRLMCTEFGVAHWAPADARQNYLRDVSKILASGNVAWCVSDYLGSFQIAKGAAGNRSIDSNILGSLAMGKG